MKAITEEQLRILVAAAEGRLTFRTPSFRYEIAGEEPPNRRERERLQKRGLLSRPSSNLPILTERGREALATAPIRKGNGIPKAVQTTLADLAGRSEEGSG